MAPPADRRAALTLLGDTLLAGRNSDGGWGYYPGKASRLEPTCWALLALGSGKDSAAARATTAAWLMSHQQSSGVLLENTEWPVNIGFNALAAFTCLHYRDLVDDAVRRRLLDFVVASKGLAAPANSNMRQDNSLQGWSWIDATFSWVEPTCWGELALKKARAAGVGGTASEARIAEADRLLIDRSCQPGGWNFGNAVVMGQDLRAYAPTTALALLAMQDHRNHDAMVRGLTALDLLWQEETSATTLALALICYGVYGRPLDAIAARLMSHAERARSFGNLHGIAMALFALSTSGQPNAFRL